MVIRLVAIRSSVLVLYCGIYIFNMESQCTNQDHAICAHETCAMFFFATSLIIESALCSTALFLCCAVLVSLYSLLDIPDRGIWHKYTYVWIESGGAMEYGFNVCCYAWCRVHCIQSKSNPSECMAETFGIVIGTLCSNIMYIRIV
eukprot:133786_1